jgi:hypothetical protein
MFMKAIKLIFLLSFLILSASVFGQEESDDSLNELQKDSHTEAFCRNRTQILHSYYLRASNETENGNITSSVQILKDGLYAANSRIQLSFQKSLTAIVISRGLSFLNALEHSSIADRKQSSLNNFLFNYYSFIDDVANNLDRHYYSSSSGYSHFRNPNSDFEKKFITISFRQLNLIIDSMSMTKNGTIYPIGQTEMLLRALKIAAKNLSWDILQNIFGTRYACKAEALGDLATDLARYLDSANNRNEYFAVQNFVYRAKDLASRPTPCTYNNDENDDN